jgi:hypothetical protein
MGWTVWGGILVEARDFSASGCPDWLSAHPDSGSLPSSAEVKNERNFTSSLPVCLHGMYTDNFTFLSVCSFGFFFILFIILFLVLLAFHNFIYGVELCILQRPSHETSPEMVY